MSILSDALGFNPDDATTGIKKQLTTEQTIRDELARLQMQNLERNRGPELDIPEKTKPGLDLRSSKLSDYEVRPRPNLERDKLKFGLQKEYPINQVEFDKYGAPDASEGALGINTPRQQIIQQNIKTLKDRFNKSRSIGSPNFTLEYSPGGRGYEAMNSPDKAVRDAYTDSRGLPRIPDSDDVTAMPYRRDVRADGTKAGSIDDLNPDVQDVIVGLNYKNNYSNQKPTDTATDTDEKSILDEILEFEPKGIEGARGKQDVAQTNTGNTTLGSKSPSSFVDTTLDTTLGENKENAKKETVAEKELGKKKFVDPTDAYVKSPTKLGKDVRLAIENRNILAKKADRIRNKINYESKLLDIILQNGRMDQYYAKREELKNLENSVYDAEAKVKEADVQLLQASVLQAVMDIGVGRTERMSALWSDATGTDVRVIPNLDITGTFSLEINGVMDPRAQSLSSNQMIQLFRNVADPAYRNKQISIRAELHMKTQQTKIETDAAIRKLTVENVFKYKIEEMKILQSYLTDTSKVTWDPFGRTAVFTRAGKVYTVQNETTTDINGIESTGMTVRDAQTGQLVTESNADVYKNAAKVEE
jgi:hypothetical protein